MASSNNFWSILIICKASPPQIEKLVKLLFCEGVIRPVNGPHDGLLGPPMRVPAVPAGVPGEQAPLGTPGASLSRHG